jgi:hypothetical protein
LPGTRPLESNRQPVDARALDLEHLEAQSVVLANVTRGRSVT